MNVFAFGSPSPSGKSDGVLSWDASMVMSLVCLMSSSSIALVSTGLSSVCVSSGLSFCAVGSCLVGVIVPDGLSGGGSGGGCGKGFLSVRRIR